MLGPCLPNNAKEPVYLATLHEPPSDRVQGEVSQRFYDHRAIQAERHALDMCYCLFIVTWTGGWVTPEPSSSGGHLCKSNRNPKNKLL